MEHSTAENSNLPAGEPVTEILGDFHAPSGTTQKHQSAGDDAVAPETDAQARRSERSRSPQLTDALEALLGSLVPNSLPQTSSSAGTEQVVGRTTQVSTPPVTTTTQNVPQEQSDAKVTQAFNLPNENTILTADSQSDDHPAGNAGSATIPGTTNDIQMEDMATGERDHTPIVESTVNNGETSSKAQSSGAQVGEINMVGVAAAETLDNSLQDTTGPVMQEMLDVPMANDAGVEGEHPEWEVDSSPIESSSDDSSDETSSEDDSDDEENAYKLLSPEEQARILMADGGSDDEGDGKKKGAGGSGAGVKSKNEVPEVVIPKPDVTITPEMPIVNLGVVETIVQNIALIKGRTSGEYQVLESGSVLCLEDRTVVGAVAEPLGRVQQPLYSVMFTNADELAAAGLSIGTTIFYSEKHAKYVFTQALKAFKGSDASNIHDEEVGDDEMEFSDDEAELAHRQKVNAAKRGAKSRGGRTDRGSHPLQQQHNATPALDYDEVEDGPYRPLARPASLAHSIGHGEAPQEAGQFPTGQHRGNSRGGRGDRGRGRGDRGRGRGSFQNRGGQSNGYSQPPQNRPTPPYQNQLQQAPTNSNGPANAYPPQVPNFFNMPQQFPPSQSQFPPWPQFSPPQQQQNQQQQPFQQPGFQQAFQNMQNMQQQQPQNAWQGMPPLPPVPNPAFFNPAFFGGQPGDSNQWNQQGGSNGNGNNGR